MHIVIVRTGGSIIDYRTYNCQEVGLAKELVKRGFQVTVILAGQNNQSHRLEVNEHQSIEIRYIKFIKVNQALAWFQGLSKLLESLRPDLLQIHEFGVFMSFITLKWAQKHHVKTVLIQGSYRETQKPIYKQLEQCFNQVFGRYILKNVNGIGCKTKMAGDYLNKYEHCDYKLTNIGLDTSRFEDRVSIYKDWRKELSIEHSKCLLYVGKMEQRRDVHFLIKILKSLPTDFVLILAGNGPGLESLRLQVKKDKLEGRCIFLGQLLQEELPSLYMCADLFLLASHYEIYGMVILESMYFGLPVVSSLTAGSQAIIDNNKNGLIIDSWEETVWIKRILSLFDNKRLPGMSYEAKQKIKKSFTWDKASDSFISLYNSTFYENSSRQ